MSSVVGVLTILVYLVLMPMLVFFFLKDKDIILGWFIGFMPGERGSRRHGVARGRSADRQPCAW